MTDTEAEAPTLWPSVTKIWLIGKAPDAVKIEGRRRRGQQSMRWLGSITDSMDMNLSKLHEIVKDREAWRTAVHGAAKNQTWLSDWTTTICECKILSCHIGVPFLYFRPYLFWYSKLFYFLFGYSQLTKEFVMDREAWRAAIHGVANDWATELNWTELN